MPDNEPLLPKHGGYRKLKSFQIAQLAYDVTVRFCDRYIDRRSRTRDQMTQAARSGVQNIAEGSQVSGTSKKMELKLTNVARSSLEELRLDYEDFLRQRRLAQWGREDPRRAQLIARRPATADDVAAWVREVHDGAVPKNKRGQSGQNGQNGQSMKSTSSTKSIVSAVLRRNSRQRRADADRRSAQPAGSPTGRPGRRIRAGRRFHGAPLPKTSATQNPRRGHVESGPCRP